jgi:hypothetical protein
VVSQQRAEGDVRVGKFAVAELHGLAKTLFSTSKITQGEISQADLMISLVIIGSLGHRGLKIPQSALRILLEVEFPLAGGKKLARCTWHGELMDGNGGSRGGLRVGVFCGFEENCQATFGGKTQVDGLVKGIETRGTNLQDETSGLQTLKSEFAGIVSDGFLPGGLALAAQANDGIPNALVSTFGEEKTRETGTGMRARL